MATASRYYGTVSRADLEGISGRNLEVTFTLDAPSMALNGGRLVATDPVVVKTEADGSFEVDLISNAEISGPTLYMVRLRYDAPGGGRREMDLFWFYARAGGGPVTSGKDVDLGGDFLVILSETQPNPWPRGRWWYQGSTGLLYRIKGDI